MGFKVNDENETYEQYMDRKDKYDYEALEKDYVDLQEAYSEINKTIQHQAKIIELLKQSNEFYACPIEGEVWGSLEEQQDIIHPDDIENVKGLMIGGKLARQIKRQVDDLEKEKVDSL